MPSEYDNTEIDRLILENQDLSATRIIRDNGLRCSDTHICRRRKMLGIEAKYPTLPHGERRHKPRPKDTELAPVECKCPKCEQRYTVQMFWTGRGVPRRLCDSCRYTAEKMDYFYHVAASEAHGSMSISRIVFGGVL